MIRGLYFWNADQLAREHQQETISEERVIRHFTFFMCFLSGVFLFPIHLVPEEGSRNGLWSQIILYLISALITYFGIWHNYRINQNGDGIKFFLRLFSRCLPVTVRLFAFALPVISVLGAVVGLTDTISAEAWIATSTIFGPAYLAIYYWYMAKFMRVASGETNA